MGGRGLQIFLKAHRFFSMNFSQQKLLVEASLYLLAARCLIGFVPFRHLSALLDEELNAAVSQEIGIGIAQDVKWAIDSASRHLPVRLVCFPRGIAAYMMLHRRQVDIRLHYGISNRRENIYAGHVWVTYGNFGIIGCEQLEQYTVLMSFPSKAVVSDRSKNT